VAAAAGWVLLVVKKFSKKTILCAVVVVAIALLLSFLATDLKAKRNYGSIAIALYLIVAVMMVFATHLLIISVTSLKKMNPIAANTMWWTAVGAVCVIAILSFLLTIFQ
jgi:hypothetical protein